MYIWAQDGKSFVNSENVKYFCIVEYAPTYEILADEECLGEYLNEDDAIIALNKMFRQLEVGSSSYYMD